MVMSLLLLIFFDNTDYRESESLANAFFMIELVAGGVIWCVLLFRAGRE
jgi:hypothetical protein